MPINDKFFYINIRDYLALEKSHELIQLLRLL